MLGGGGGEPNDLAIPAGRAGRTLRVDQSAEPELDVVLEALVDDDSAEAVVDDDSLDPPLDPPAEDPEDDPPESFL